MRQVPHYLIIGNGRMARHMAFYLEHLGLGFDTFARSTHDFSALPALLSQSTHVLLLIKDDAIEPFIKRHLSNMPHTLVHFSGSLTTSYAYSAHPLVSFGPTLHASDLYRSMWFITQENGPLFAKLLPGLPNASMAIPAQAKALYHSMCVLSGNFTCLLWQKFFNTLKDEWQIPNEAAQVYLNLILTNISANPQTALTGPLVRNDKNTITQNLNALENDPYQAVYQAFVTAYQQSKEQS